MSDVFVLIDGCAAVYKVGTEVTLLVTLVFAVMLKIDLSTESLPCVPWTADEEDLSCGDSFIGIVMFLTNTGLPSATLVIGFIANGISYDVKFPDDLSQIGATETDNPMLGRESDGFESEDELGSRSSKE